MTAVPLALEAPRLDSAPFAPLSSTSPSIRVFYLRATERRVTFFVRDASGQEFGDLASFIGSLPGVTRAISVRALRAIHVSFDPALQSPAQILSEVRRTPPSAWAAAGEPEQPNEWRKAGLTAGVLALSLTGLVPAPIAVGAVALTAIPSFKRAAQNLAKRKANVDVLDATAIVICLAQADPITAGVMTTLLAVGDIVLDRTQDRARTAISRLMKLDDCEAFRLDEAGTPVRVLPSELAPGDHIVIYPGARVPADGVIIEGSLAVDEKAVTGESVPRERFVGDHAMAASVAVRGQAVMRVERVGRDTVAGRIIQILESAGTKPMTLQKNCESVADRLVLPTFGIAGAAWALSGVINRATSVIITDFGTGIRVAVPTAALTAMTLAARRGVLVKGATYFERLAEADTVVFDKTGTLTLGVPEVTRVVPTSRWSEHELMAFAAAAEGHHSHPIADAMRRYAERIGAERLLPEQTGDAFRIGLGIDARVDGHRVSIGSPRMMRELSIDATSSLVHADELASRGESSVLVAIDGELAGVVGYADALRDESREVVAAIKAGGRRRVIMLSGDARAPAEAVGRKVGIDEIIAEVLPEHKADVVRRLKSEGHCVVMIGDGINDAPALATADVGISLGGGPEVAMETADVVLLDGGLERLPHVFDEADAAMARVKRVLNLVVIPNSVAIAAGAVGLFNPLLATLFNNGSTIFAAIYAAAPLLRR